MITTKIIDTVLMKQKLIEDYQKALIAMKPDIAKDIKNFDNFIIGNSEFIEKINKDSRESVRNIAALYISAVEDYEKFISTKWEESGKNE